MIAALRSALPFRLYVDTNDTGTPTDGVRFYRMLTIIVGRRVLYFDLRLSAQAYTVPADFFEEGC